MRCNMTLLVMRCHWHWHQHHMKPMAKSVATLHSLGQDNQNKVQHDFSVMWHHWHKHWHHMILITLSIEPLHSLCQANLREVQHDFGHVMLLTLVLPPHVADDIINDTIVSPRSWWSKWGATLPFYSCYAINTDIGIKWCWWCYQWQHCIP